MKYYFKKQKNNSGFSLLELILYMGLLTTITLIVSAVFVSYNRGRGFVESKAQVNSAVNFAVEKISQDLKSASTVSLPAIAGGSSDNLEISIGGSPVKYCVQGGQLRRETTVAACSASSEAVTSSIVAMGTPTFTRLENTNTTLSKTIISIEISLTASYNSPSPDWQYSENKKTTVSLRQ